MATSPTSQKPLPSAATTVSSPTVSSPSTATNSHPPARVWYEYERGRGPAGTKVLLVEWEEDDATRGILGTWTVGWDGKPKHEPSLLLAAESEWGSSDPHRSASSLSGSLASPAASPSTTAASGDGEPDDAAQEAHPFRLYFLLGARCPVPAAVTLTFDPSGLRGVSGLSDSSSSSPSPTTTTTPPVTVWEVRPEPAPSVEPEHGAEDGSDGGKGPLHTRWAAHRLSSLRREIAEEAQRNCEGVALQMALGERDFIERNFGAAADRRAARGGASGGGLSIRPAAHGEVPLSPHSPLSPGGSRLSDRLRGLKLQTGGAGGEQGPGAGAGEGEVAVPLCKRQLERLAASSSPSSASPPLPPPSSLSAVPAPAANQAPPTPQPAGMSSIGAILAGRAPQAQGESGAAASTMAFGSTGVAGVTGAAEEVEEDEEEGADELFALPLSPRSPEMTKSPFSFAAEDTKRYLSAQRVA